MSGKSLQKFSYLGEKQQEKTEQVYKSHKLEINNGDPYDQIENFIHTQVVGRGLDERTAKAYQMDLEHFYLWLEIEEGEKKDTFRQKTVQKKEQVVKAFSLSGTAVTLATSGGLRKNGYEERMETYLKYLAEEKRLRFSTISRKQRVLRYYLSYLTKLGIVEGYRPLEMTGKLEENRNSKAVYLTKNEIDLFFQSIQKEYEELDSDFRKCVCLRDQLMMGLLFYHRIEISELLRMEVSDYDRKTAVLTVKRKREKERQVYLFSKALQEQMVRWLDEHEYFEHGGEYQGRMFLSKLGKPLSMKMVINIFDKYRVKAGIEKECTPKDLKNGLGRYAEELVREMG